MIPLILLTVCVGMLFHQSVRFSKERGDLAGAIYFVGNLSIWVIVIANWLPWYIGVAMLLWLGYIVRSFKRIDGKEDIVL